MPNPVKRRATMEHCRSNPAWSRKTLLRYALFQVPGIILVGVFLWVLHALLGVSARIAWVLLLLWLVKDALMFFFVWPAYQGSEGDGWYSLVGLRGEVRRPLRPEGYIRIRGVLWKARAEDQTAQIPPGTQVDVVGRDGIQLIVRPRP
ncbi:NfeD family protein [Desulfonatronum lacustre]|uniref:NfeD family protein n=1 Tax=Desulfonatronum lacustre TaxID=66849 RepID=UPI0012EC04AE|nr:NfeD family protein [Desulfonatronum lacustre]